MLRSSHLLLNITIASVLVRGDGFTSTVDDFLSNVRVAVKTTKDVSDITNGDVYNNINAPVQFGS